MVNQPPTGAGRSQSDIDDIVCQLEHTDAFTGIAEYMIQTGFDDMVRSNGSEAAKQLVTRFLLFSHRGGYPASVIHLDLRGLIQNQMSITHPEYENRENGNALNLPYLINKFVGPQFNGSLRDPRAELIRTAIILERMELPEVEKFKEAFLNATGFTYLEYINLCLEFKTLADQGDGLISIEDAVALSIVDQSHPLSVISRTFEEHQQLVIDMNRARVAKEAGIEAADVTVENLRGFHGLKTITSIETKPLIRGNVQGRDYLIAPLPDLLLAATSIQSMKWQIMGNMTSTERKKVNNWMGDINEGYLASLVSAVEEIRITPFTNTIDLDEDHHDESRADMIIETERYIVIIEQKSRAVNLDFYFDEEKFEEAVDSVNDARDQIVATINDHRQYIADLQKPLIGIIVSDHPIRAFNSEGIPNVEGLLFVSVNCNYAELTNLLISEFIDNEIDEFYSLEDKHASINRFPADVTERQLKLTHHLMELNELDQAED